MIISKRCKKNFSLLSNVLINISIILVNALYQNGQSKLRMNKKIKFKKWKKNLKINLKKKLKMNKEPF